MTANPQHAIRFFFEWGGGCLWPGSDATDRALGPGPYDLARPCPLPLSPATLDACAALSAWFDTSLNTEYPPDPGPWSPEEYERFAAAAAALLERVRRELGSRYDVVELDRGG